MPDPTFRTRCVGRAVDRDVVIVPDRREPALFYAESTSGKTYLLRRKRGGGYTCHEQETGDQCPSVTYRHYCKHLAALDLYFEETGRDDSSGATMSVRINGRTRTLQS
jgi:hypothetical protein